MAPVPSQGDDHVCQQLCLAGLRGRTDTPVAIAQLYEWLGICQAMLGQSLDIVQETFDQALEIDPSNGRLQANKNLALEIASGKSGKPSQWEPATAVDARRARRSLDSLVEAQVDRINSRQQEQSGAELLDMAV
jgi:hypothetical protein